MTGPMRIPVRYLVLHTDRPVSETGTNLRGYIGNRFPEYPLLHHHLKRPILTYPRIQYKVIGGTPSILGIADGAAVLKDISDEITELVFTTGRYSVTSRVIHDHMIPISRVNDPIQYRFLTPWLALNQENYRKFGGISDWKERKQFLNRILTGNLLSMAKGLGVVIEHELVVTSHLEKVPARFKGVELTGFTGSFRVNLQVPEFFGIGKGVSQGFGTIRRVSHQNQSATP
jgi:hypothetical protein